MAWRRKTLWIVPSLGVGLVAVLLATVPPAIRQQDIEGRPIHEPPPLESFTFLDDFRDTFEVQAVTGETVDCDIQIDTVGRSLTLQWSYWVDDGGWPTLAASERAPVALSFWPTCARYLGERKLAVAGKSRATGEAIIEVWTIAKPTIGIVGNETRMRPGQVIDRRVAFVSRPADGVGVVRALWRNRALANEHVFVLSFEQRDVYGIDLATGQASLAAVDGDPVVPLPTSDLLRRRWPSYSGPYRHANHGDMYALTLESAIAREGDPALHTLYLLDSDRDGELDGFLEVTGANEESLGLHDEALWEPLWD